MKRLFLLFAALVLCLAGCGKEEPVFYAAQEYILHNTGDIDLVEYSYDSQWRPTCVQIQLNGQFSSQVDYVYSEDGASRTTYETSAILDPQSYETRWEFDDQGNILSAQIYRDGQLAQTAHYTYDSQGRETGIRVIGPNQELISQVDRTYNKDGNLLTQSTKMGESRSFAEYTYDRKGRITQWKQYHNNDLTLTRSYTWDGSTATCTAKDSSGSIGGITVTTYDRWGNVLTEEVKDRGGSMIHKSWYVYTAEDGTVSGSLPE